MISLGGMLSHNLDPAGVVFARHVLYSYIKIFPSKEYLLIVVCIYIKGGQTFHFSHSCLLMYGGGNLEILEDNKFSTKTNLIYEFHTKKLSNNVKHVKIQERDLVFYFNLGLVYQH